MRPIPSSAQVADSARSRIGAPGWSGLCEKFTRTAFGFPAAYPSAYLAWKASKAAGPIHTDLTPPPGVPVFWDITYGPNAPYDHVAVSLGGGRVVSTTIGPGRTPGIIGIADLTRKWGMVYRGWAEYYHGVRVYTSAAQHTTTHTTSEETPEVITDKDRDDIAAETVRRLLDAPIKLGPAEAKRTGRDTLDVGIMLRYAGAALYESREQTAELKAELDEIKKAISK